jgi:hypothetical protein
MRPLVTALSLLPNAKIGAAGLSDWNAVFGGSADCDHTGQVK